MDITLNQLHTILTIFECGSVTRAAEVLDRPQPSLSRTLKEVETNVGSALFDRSTRSYELTDVGRIIIRHAKSMLAEVNHASDELMTLQNGMGKRVHIGVHPIAAASIVGPAAARCHERKPEVELILEEERTPNLLLEFSAGRFDLLVSTIPSDPVDDLIFDVLFESRLGIYVGQQHPLVGKPSLGFRDIANFNWIYPMPHAPRMEVMRNLCDLHAVDMPEPAVTTMSLTLTRHAILNNDWVVLTQGDLFGQDLLKNRIVELKIPDAMPTIPIAVVHRRASINSEAAEYFVECLHAEARRFGDAGSRAA